MQQAEVTQLIQHTFGMAPTAVECMAFGHTSVTYKVDVEDRQVIVRTNASPSAFSRTGANLATLRKLGLPAPRLIAADLSLSRFDTAYLILESIPGRDLRFELEGMTRQQQHVLATQLVGFQRRVGSLPLGKGYGYAALGKDGPATSWLEVVESQLSDVTQMTSPRLASFARSVRKALQVRVKEMPAVPATCFLDDLTTKNVIVQDGALQGVVDFDHVCYGHPLFWIALSSTAIVSDVGETHLTYTEELCESWGVDPLSAGALALYTAVHCHRFLADRSEEGPVWLDRMLTYGERQVTFAMDAA